VCAPLSKRLSPLFHEGGQVIQLINLATLPSLSVFALPDATQLRLAEMCELSELSPSAERFITYFYGSPVFGRCRYRKRSSLVTMAGAFSSAPGISLRNADNNYSKRSHRQMSSCCLGCAGCALPTRLVHDEQISALRIFGQGNVDRPVTLVEQQ
jgi:hypothetical protein